MIGFGCLNEVELDVSRFSNDEETYLLATVVAKYAEMRRGEYRATEKPIMRGLLEVEGYWSDSVPWYEWMSEPQVLQPCADECLLTIHDLAEAIAYQIRPSNWQVFSWMAEALKGREYEAGLENSLVRYSTALQETREKKQLDAKAAAEALHNKPGGSRDKQEKIREIWASGKYSSRSICAEQESAGLGMSFDTARKALRNTPKPIEPMQRSG